MVVEVEEGTTETAEDVPPPLLKIIIEEAGVTGLRPPISQKNQQPPRLPSSNNSICMIGMDPATVVALVVLVVADNPICQDRDAPSHVRMNAMNVIAKVIVTTVMIPNNIMA